MTQFITTCPHCSRRSLANVNEMGMTTRCRFCESRSRITEREDLGEASDQMGDWARAVTAPAIPEQISQKAELTESFTRPR